ncbi:site-specific integrase [Amnibacterium sp.]|uniref:site-specific integrase n=1 Tax=Amnibacterium sp. TaxID=1872496 RepID=UPI00260A80E7|nr:site-specific integrase [Amnibacterium sp.]MCU1472372.1 site-specific integrase [Amnibacterium sp.]
MGSVEPYATKGGRRYRVLYRKPDHVQTQRRGFRTKKEAELFLASMELNKARGVYVDSGRSRIRLADWLDQWFADRVDLRPSTRDRVAGIIRRDLNPSLGAYPLGEISPSVVQRWIAELSGRLGPASVRKCVHTLSGALDAAVADGRIVLNPARGTKLPRVTKSGKRYLTHEQVDALAEAVDRIGGGQQHGAFNGYGDLVRVLAYCGLRWGEVSGLRVMDVDLRRRRLAVRHTVVEVNGLQHESTPKDYEARSVPIPAALADRLVPLVADRPQEAPLFPSARSRSWLRNRVFREGWLDRAAVEIGQPGLTPHELRHTAASLAVSSGAHVKAVQRILGHASAAVTLDVYSDLFDDDLDAVAEALDLHIRRVADAKGPARGAADVVS